MTHRYLDIELQACKDQQFLLVHKCGVETMLALLREKYGELTLQINATENSILWTVLRDPYERFISAVTYDLLYGGQNISNENLDKYVGTKTKINKYLFNYIAKLPRYKGILPHSIPFSYYLNMLNRPLDFYVLNKDLQDFIDINFGIDKRIHLNKTDTNSKKVVEDYFNDNIQLKSYVEGCLAMDYDMLETLDANGIKWHWASTGKVF